MAHHVDHFTGPDGLLVIVAFFAILWGGMLLYHRLRRPFNS